MLLARKTSEDESIGMSTQGAMISHPQYNNVVLDLDLKLSDDIASKECPTPPDLDPKLMVQLNSIKQGDLDAFNIISTELEEDQINELVDE